MRIKRYRVGFSLQRLTMTSGRLGRIGMRPHPSKTPSHASHMFQAAVELQGSYCPCSYRLPAMPYCPQLNWSDLDLAELPGIPIGETHSHSTLDSNFEARENRTCKPSSKMKMNL